MRLDFPLAPIGVNLTIFQIKHANKRAFKCNQDAQGSEQQRQKELSPGKSFHWGRKLFYENTREPLTTPYGFSHCTEAGDADHKVSPSWLGDRNDDNLVAEGEQQPLPHPAESSFPRVTAALSVPFPLQLHMFVLALGL